MARNSKHEDPWDITRRLASHAPITPTNVSNFVKIITPIWNSDAEAAHHQEYVLRSRVIRAIATKKLNHQDAIDVCKHLHLLETRKLEHWFA